ncbi:MAG: hypothetical protein WAL84_07265, partial [Candidatus Dormiibacterota bacterium]
MQQAISSSSPDVDEPVVERGRRLSRTSERRRGFTAARIIALIVIALGVLGLVYVQLTGGTSAVSV